ncbi:putative virion structural protein [Erwinia phage pEa_SNUABM_8]|nr:putative virion structural protein [Erwinia phage pEa_SNUABM_8]QVW54926.1 hypothetical protein pEaSNUABM4_00173 [Erwinia phage pEa_SNUABM_4]
MGLYSQPPLELLCRLIMRDNPQLAIPLDPTKVMVLSGPLTTGLGTSGRNTRVILNGKTGSGIVGKKEFFYDRIKLSSLFNGITVVFDAAGGAAKVSDLLPALNEQYGIQLSPADLSNGDTVLGYAYTPTPVTFNIATTSLAYSGTLTATWRRLPVGTFPESGPGSKVMLIGDLNEGYFGRVTAAEMMTQGEFFSNYFADHPRNTAAPIIDPALYWLKFALDGKFVFVPSHSLIANITWDQINANGNADGSAPFPLLLKKGTDNHFFNIRLPRFSTTYEIAPGRSDPTGDNNRLFAKVHKQAYGTGVWDAVTLLDFTSDFVWWNRRSDMPTVEQRFISQFTTSGVSSQLSNVNANWRPVFTLVDGKLILMPVNSVTGVPTGRIKAPVLTIDREPDPLQPKRVTDVTGTLLRAFPKPRLQPIELYVVLPVSKIVPINTIKRFPVNITVTFDARFPLAAANGELDGFR